ncbi:diacylglycerol/lipid kinase family protein [Agromyces ramosus]|uniref:Diacylglycerol kinase (ATP) n=1 Tax=Agromyces ramosus TaxID=33879 RepID=A0ABU0RCC7_9MICO|nr:diacylglycerol kinase family protein [Agromyces ramosus]MDQ0894911.1 diacylglycerol kinase (ATP) [Agromyces ramosus]
MTSETPLHESTDHARRAALIYNPVKVEPGELRPIVEAAEQEAGWGPTLWLETTEEDPGTGQAEEALSAGVAVVIAAGGDGTVRVVAEVLRGSGVPLALLPSGTGNLLARNLDLTLDDAEHSLRSAFAGENRPIDMAVIDIRDGVGGSRRHAYLVMAGLGLDAKMLANTDDELKAKAGWLAYVKAIGVALRDKNQLRLRFKLDNGGTRRMRAHTIMIGNCGSLPANILLLPEAAVDDGEFDIVVLRPEGFVGWLQITVKIFWENGVLRRTTAGRKLMGATKEVRALNYLRGRELIVSLSRPEQIQLDGDGFGVAQSFKTWVDPRSLLVRVPAEE